MTKKNLGWFRAIFSSPVKTFVLLAGIFGMLIIFLSPPLTGADEEAHFVRAYGISNGDFRLYDTRQVSVPESFRKTIGCFQTKTSEPGVMYKYDYSNYGIAKRASFECALKLPLNSSETELLYTSAQSYSPTTYIPQTVAILLGRVLDLPIVAIVYLIRVFVLIAYLFMLALAIKLLPVRKWALVGIALLPTPIMFLTNPGGDYMLFGSISVLVAIIIRSIYIPMSQLRRENKILTAVLTVAALLMVLPKGIFPGVCLLPLILFYGGFGYQRIKKIMIIVTALAIGLSWQKFGISVELITMGVGTNSLFDFPAAFIETMFTRWVDTDFVYMGDAVGNIPIPGNHLGMPAVIVTIINILFAAYVFVTYPEKLKPRVSKRQITALIYTGVACALAIIVGSFAALFIGGAYLQTTGRAIRGVQTRYLFPAFFALAMLPFIRRVFVESEKSMARIVVIGSVICLSSAVLITAIAYHWWNPLGIA